ncbi:hypothetical protein Tco_1503437 [Tanacetum coccineum]
MDYRQTKEYLPRVHRTRQMDEELRESYRTLEKRLFHEGRIATPSFISENNMLSFLLSWLKDDVYGGIIMANLPNNNEFALAAEAAPDNMNGWVEEEDPEMEEEEEDPEEDPEMEEEEEEMDADEQWDGPEWILPYQGADPLYPPPPASDSEAEAEG